MKQYSLAFFLLILTTTAYGNATIDNSLIKEWGYQLSSAITYNSHLCSGSIKAKNIQLTAIKSLKPLAEVHDTYYRFTLGMEIFSSTTEMEKRVDELKHPNYPNSLESKSCSLIRFFSCGNNVYFVHSDALLFESEMKRINRLYHSAVCGKES